MERRSRYYQQARLYIETSNLKFVSELGPTHSAAAEGVDRPTSPDEGACVEGAYSRAVDSAERMF